MTDNDIIEALKHCASSKTSDACKGCPLLRDNGSCRDDGLLPYESALDVINHQKAEIEILKLENKNLSEVNNSLNYQLDVWNPNEAIKEFAERLKRRHLRLRPCFGVVRCCLSENDIDNLVKETMEVPHAKTD